MKCQQVKNILEIRNSQQISDWCISSYKHLFVHLFFFILTLLQFGFLPIFLWFSNKICLCASWTLSWSNFPLMLHSDSHLYLILFILASCQTDFMLSERSTMEQDMKLQWDRSLLLQMLNCVIDRMQLFFYQLSLLLLILLLSPLEVTESASQFCFLFPYPLLALTVSIFILFLIY